MNKVITISLNSKTYNLEETAYAVLRTYLDNASTRLADNPDKEEIVADLELAIADKCNNHLTNSKNVISMKEIELILIEMGPVEGDNKDTEAATTHTTNASETKQDEKPIKKLYRIKEGAIITGVCNGLGAYFNLDVTLVRIIFIVATIVTGGVWIAAYIILSFIVPVADTPEERNAAAGRGAVTAQLLIDKAKHKYNEFKSSDDWKKWKIKMKEERKRWKYEQRYREKIHTESPAKTLVDTFVAILWMSIIVFVLWFAYTRSQFVHRNIDRGIDAIEYEITN